MKIDWVEIPAGEFIFGLSERQREELSARLWIDYGLWDLPSSEQEIVISLIHQYRQMSTRTGVENILRQRTKEQADYLRSIEDYRTVYFHAERDLIWARQQQVVTLPTFYVSRTPFTYEMANHFLRWTPLGEHLRGSIDRRDQGRNGHLPEMPVTAYWDTCRQITEYIGARLPTVYEWEKAARGTDGRLYPWGDEWIPQNGNFGYEFRPQYSREHGIWSTKINEYPAGASPYGVLDMAGNSAEWTISSRDSHLDTKQMVRLSKGYSVRLLPQPKWFWSIVALEGAGHDWYTGFRPILNQWSRQTWQGISIQRDKPTN